MSAFIETNSLAWQPVRPDVAHGVSGRILLENGIRIMLVRVAPGGGFGAHRDGYGHLFYFLSGQGIVRVANRESDALPGLAVRIAAGETHSYENRGSEYLMLISVNIPQPA